MPNDLKKRPALQSVAFMIDECCDAMTALYEVNQLFLKIRKMNREERDNLPLRPEIVQKMLGIIMDQFCIRVRNLFDPSADKRGDPHSLKKYYRGELIEKLRTHPLTISCIKAANKNIAHLADEYTQWPQVDDILSSELKSWLEKIRMGI